MLEDVLIGFTTKEFFEAKVCQGVDIAFCAHGNSIASARLASLLTGVWHVLQYFHHV